MNTVEPVVVGVPDSTPAGLNVNPAGSTPLVTANVNGAVPALGLKVRLYGFPTEPSGIAAGCTAIAGHTRSTTRLKARLPGQSLASCTATVNGKVPAAVGVPDRTPAGDSVKPGGSVPDATVNVKGATPELVARAWL